MRLLRVICFLVLLLATWGIACQSAGHTCAQRTTDAQNATIAAESQAEADLSCATDSDCILASNSSVCWNSCGVVLNQAGAAQLASAIAQINETTCATFTADGCEPNPAPPCGAFGAHCVAGQCKEGGPGEDAGTDAGYAPKCVAAGGTCANPGTCATLAPNSAQDCNAPGPVGEVCCLDIVGTECHAAGGTCTILVCAVTPPTSAQDCETYSPNPAGFGCCIVTDASDASVDGGSDASDAAGE